MKQKKIDFRKTKYMLPAIALPFIIILGWMVIDIAEFEPDEKESVLKKSDEFNASLPGVSDKAAEIRSKMQEMMGGYDRSKSSTAIGIFEAEQEEKNSILSGYTEEEKNFVDSLEAVRKAELERLRELARNSQDEPSRIYEVRNSMTQQERQQAEKVIIDNPQMDQVTRQMQLLQRMANGERILTPEEEQKEKERLLAEEVRRRTLDSIARADGPVAVSKALDAAERHFNTVGRDRQDSHLISGRVDELVKVKDGSRLRIRLSEDVEIDGVKVKAGTCLYANVTGFSAQRVKANITSVLLGGKIRKVDLSVYDIDGQEGFYVPTSAFRDLAKEAGGNAMNMNMNINSSGQNLESMAMQTLQQTLRSITSAASANIKQNRAKIKYNTEIYLVDNNVK